MFYSFFPCSTFRYIQYADDFFCRNSTSQYFLITPKLLPSLKYARRMRVHVICSGEYVPASEKQEEWRGGMGRLVGRVRAAVGGAA